MESNKHATESDLSPSRKLIIVSYLGTRKIMFKRALKGDMLFPRTVFLLRGLNNSTLQSAGWSFWKSHARPQQKLMEWMSKFRVMVASMTTQWWNMVECGEIWWNSICFLFLICFFPTSSTHTHTQKKKKKLLVAQLLTFLVSGFNPFPPISLWAYMSQMESSPSDGSGKKNVFKQTTEPTWDIFNKHLIKNYCQQTVKHHLPAKSPWPPNYRR